MRLRTLAYLDAVVCSGLNENEMLLVGRKILLIIRKHEPCMRSTQHEEDEEYLPIGVSNVADHHHLASAETARVAVQ